MTLLEENKLLKDRIDFAIQVCEDSYEQTCSKIALILEGYYDEEIEEEKLNG